MNLTYSSLVPDEDIIGRLLGPDQFGAYVQAVAVNRDVAVGKTRVTLRPVPADQLAHLTRDQFGQLWLPLPVVAS